MNDLQLPVESRRFCQIQSHIWTSQKISSKRPHKPIQDGAKVSTTNRYIAAPKEHRTIYIYIYMNRMNFSIQSLPR